MKACYHYFNLIGIVIVIEIILMGIVRGGRGGLLYLGQYHSYVQQRPIHRLQDIAHTKKMAC